MSSTRRASVLVVLGLAAGLGLAAPAVLAQSVTTAPAAIEAEKLDRIWAALDLPGALAIMQEEGEDMSRDIAADYLPPNAGQGWSQAVARIYDPRSMARLMRDGFSADLAGADPLPMIDFFESPLGLRIVELEMSARRAFLDPQVEEAARARVQDGEVSDGRAALIDRFIAVNDLVEYNVAGAMNTNYAFYSGLSQVALFEMSEEDILAQVWGQAEENRTDTEEWLRAYLTMAYEPLSDDEIKRYIDFSRTEEGQRLNRALFAGFGSMYLQQYRALGLAVAQQLMAEEL